MVRDPNKNEEKLQRQLGSTDEPLVLEFRRQCKRRKFTQVDVLRVMLNWWLAKGFEAQKHLYYLSNEKLREHFETDDQGHDAPPELEILLQQLLEHGQALQEILPAKKRRTAQTPS